MSWSRIESAFWRHPKFEGWKPSEKWAIGELIGYACEYRTDGIIPQDLSLLPRSITPALIAKAQQSGWIDVSEDGDWHIHDWHKYHPKDPTASDRVLRMRRKQQRKQAVTETVTVTGTTNTSTKDIQQPTNTQSTLDPGINNLESEWDSD